MSFRKRAAIAHLIVAIIVVVIIPILLIVFWSVPGRVSVRFESEGLCSIYDL